MNAQMFVIYGVTLPLFAVAVCACERILRGEWQQAERVMVSGVLTVALFAGMRFVVAQ